MIEIACISDEQYLRYTGAMLHSVLAHTAPGNLAISVLHASPISEPERSRLRQVTDARGATLTFVAIEEQAVAAMPRGNFSTVIWLRIFLPELMPTKDKVLYLDSDLIVTDDLAPLWHTDPDDHLVAAVTNPLYPFMPPHPQADLGLTNAADYFNSGVLLMNLSRMREEGTSRALREFARTHPESGAPDQDALNVVCRDRWLRLHPRWNVQTTFFDLTPAQLPIDPVQLREALESPAVIHFIGVSKPWHYLCSHPRRGLFLEHARATPWGEPPIAGRSLRNMMLRQLPVAWIYRLAAAKRKLRAVWAPATPRFH